MMEVVCREAGVSASWVIYFIAEYEAAIDRGNRVRTRVPAVGPVSWNSSSMATHKLNNDGATFGDIGGIGLGGVLCDRLGNAFKSFSEFMSVKMDALTAECLAL